MLKSKRGGGNKAFLVRRIGFQYRTFPGFSQKIGITGNILLKSLLREYFILYRYHI